MFHRVHDLARKYLTDRMQLELEGRDDPEIATSTAHAPEQVGVLADTGSEHPSIGSDDLDCQQIVNGQAVLAHEPAQAAAEGQARQASSAYGAGGRGESIGLRCLHKLAKPETCLSPGRLLCWIDPDAFHAREIDDHATIADGTATDAVASTAHSHKQVVEAPEPDGSHDIDHVGAADESRRVLINHAVPDPASRVIAVIVRADQFAPQMGFEVLHNSWLQCILKHTCCSSLSSTTGGCQLLVVRDRAKLLHQSQSIKESPELRDLSGSETVKHETRHCYLSSGWGDSLKFTSMGAPTCPAFGDPVLFGHHGFNSRKPIGKRAPKAEGERLEAFQTHLLHPGEHDRRVSGEELVCYGHMPPRAELLDYTTYYRVL